MEAKWQWVKTQGTFLGITIPRQSILKALRVVWIDIPRTGREGLEGFQGTEGFQGLVSSIPLEAKSQGQKLQESRSDLKKK